MPTHAEKKILPHTPEQMFALVADVENYPKFLPWCVACRIKRREGNVIIADMAIGFKMIREKFTSKVTLEPSKRVDVAYTDGPFKYLNNHWAFSETEDGQCELDFFLDFEFKSRLLQKVMGAVFNEAVSIMVTAFEKRAMKLYGPITPKPT